MNRILMLPLALVLGLGACTMNQKEQRALIGGGVGAVGGGILAGQQGALIGAGAGALLGAVTADEKAKEVHHHHHHHHGKKKK